LTVRGALKRSFGLWFAHAGAMAFAAGVVLAPLELIAAVFDPAADVAPNTAAYGALLVAINAVALPGVSGALVHYLVEGRAPLAGYSKLEGSLGSLVLASFLGGLGTLAGLALLIVPGLILAARWSLIVPVVALERRGARAALGRSNELVSGRTGAVLAVLALAALAGVLIAVVPAIAVEILSPGFAASVAWGLAFDVIALPLLVTTAYVLYRQLNDA
jgi:hypothetical protein